MKYLRKVYRPDGTTTEAVLSADEMIEKLAIIAIYLQCESLKGMYAFSVERDTNYFAMHYKLVIYQPNGGGIIHTYTPIKTKKS